MNLFINNIQLRNKSTDAVYYFQVNRKFQTKIGETVKELPFLQSDGCYPLG